MRRKAVFTIVRDEKVFLPVWLRYYRQHFPEEDIFVLNHDSTQKPDVGSVNLVSVHREESHSYMWLTSVCYHFQRFLLNSYQWVLFCDVDEIITHTLGIGKFIDSIGKEYDLFRCSGYDVIQMEDEPPLDWSQPILLQRTKCYSNSWLSKPLLSCKSLPWGVGFHELLGHAPAFPTRELVLLHLKRVDYQTAFLRNVNTSLHPWSQYDISMGFGRQNTILNENEFARWFYSDITSGQAVLQPIPDEWKVV